jgi:hypothetical protein
LQPEKKKFTTVRLSEEAKQILDSLKIRPNDTYDDVVRRLGIPEVQKALQDLEVMKELRRLLGAS